MEQIRDAFWPEFYLLFIACANESAVVAHVNSFKTFHSCECPRMFKHFEFDAVTQTVGTVKQTNCLHYAVITFAFYSGVK